MHRECGTGTGKRREGGGIASRAWSAFSTASTAGSAARAADAKSEIIRHKTVREITESMKTS